jgi:hypothetical protein
MNQKVFSGVLACALAAVLLCGACDNEMLSEEEMLSENDVESASAAYDSSWYGWLEVKVNGVWKGVSCSGSRPVVTTEGHHWDVSADRVLTHRSQKRRLKCPEGAVNTECTCTSGSGERMHGTTTGSTVATGPVQLSLSQTNGAWIFADLDSGYKDVCVRVEGTKLVQRYGWKYPCHNFRLRKP